MKIRARAPLRVSLAGGGTDVSPYCDKHGGIVINATIDRYAHTTIELLNSDEIIFEATDLKQISKIKLSNSILLDDTLKLHKATYQYCLDNFKLNKYLKIPPISLKITTFCDSPIGSGLGTSSALVVSMLKAFEELFEYPLDNFQRAMAAYEIERVICGYQGGRQDQFSASYGGLNEFKFDNFHTRTFDYDDTACRITKQFQLELESSLLIAYTGVSRESATIIAEQTDNIKKKNKNTVSALDGLKAEAIKMYNYLEKSDTDGIISSMKDGWIKKKQLAKSIVTPEIEHIYNVAINAGASAGKVSGAGGGGCMLFYVEPEKRIQVIEAINPLVSFTSNCHFTQEGAISWATK